MHSSANICKLTQAEDRLDEPFRIKPGQASFVKTIKKESFLMVLRDE